MVRDVAHAEGKKVRLDVTGGETTLDKAVLDRLGEPLLHLLSNAVAHGLERRGGPDAGRASRPRACSRSTRPRVAGRVAIRVSDDGRGLDAGAHPRPGRSARAWTSAPRTPRSCTAWSSCPACPPPSR